MNEIAVEDSCFGSLKTDALAAQAARGLKGIMYEKTDVEDNIFWRQMHWQLEA